MLRGKGGRSTLKIALIGTRGVPAKYGGFETCAEEIGKRLAARGHHVTVYCRKSYYVDEPPTYLGMRRVCLPNLRSKTLDTMSHTFVTAWHALFQKFDVHMVFNAANSVFLYPLRIVGKKIVINTDGLEWKRSKWGFSGKAFYRMSERIACFVANRLVSDSRGMKEHYERAHHTQSTEIAYGAYVQESPPGEALKQEGLEGGRYFLQITRFEPENHPLLTIQSYRKLDTDKKLVLVGGNPYPTEYARSIEREADENVLLPGFIYDKEYLDELWCNCFAYVHGNSVGGTNPALLQAMACGTFVLAFDNLFNRDVLADCGAYYSGTPESLVEMMRWSLDNARHLDSYRRKAQERIRESYSWDRIADQYEQLFFDIHNGKHPWRLNCTKLLP